MTFQIFIDGAAGTTGLQVFDRLASRPELSVIVLGDKKRKDMPARLDAMDRADITILCLPDDAAKAAIEMAMQAEVKTRFIDASSAHRIDSDFIYGFAEMQSAQADKIASAKKVSNPGCYPTGFIALVRPLINAGILAPSVILPAFCVSGYTGGGRGMIEQYKSGEAPAFAPYGFHLEHKHLPEMKVHSGLETAPIFLPSVGNFAQGMLVNISLHRSQFAQEVTKDKILDCYQNAFPGQKLISIGPPGELTEQGFMAADYLAGRDIMELFVFSDKHADRFVLTARLDNLGKGAAGAAVQNMNLMLGLNPLAGLIL